MIIPLPENLQPYREEAEKALALGAVKDIEFSGSTYQVLVEDQLTHSCEWVFIQLEGNGEIRDAFCSSEHQFEEVGCVHLAIAYLSLFKKAELPLHMRFERSLWNHLCRLFEARIGDDSLVLIRESKQHFFCQSTLGKKIFVLETLTEEATLFFNKIILERDPETENTSLKFSNLSREEIASWKEGNPPPQLRYDLSFWSDLAKWLMSKQEQGMTYSLSFRYSKKGLPNWFQIDFLDVKVGFYISEANLPLVVGALRTVNSPLTVYQLEHSGIECVIYDKHEQVMHIEEKKGVKKLKENPITDKIPFEGWNFVPSVGFYADVPHDLLKRPTLYGVEIAQTLSEYAPLFSSLMVDTHVHLEPISLSYQLHFDQKWNLHIQAYLFEPGDLLKGDAWLMGNWAYLDDDGFYPISENRFDSIEMTINIAQVSEFVTQNRLWLNKQEGFHTHVRSIEFQLDYHISSNQRLTFTRTLAQKKDVHRQQDFGVWVYLEGYGFYSKTGSSFSFLLKPGISLSAEQIPLFIKMNRNELQLIPGFFSERCPVKQTGLKVELTDKKKVSITPEYQFSDDYRDKMHYIYDDFIYVQGEGFHELPYDLRLPEKFRHALELEGEELFLFLSYEIDTIKDHAFYIDPRLIEPTEMQLMTNFIALFSEKGKGWYRLSLFYQTDKGGRIPVNALKPLVGKKFPFAFLDQGMIDTQDKRFSWLRQLDKERFDKASKTILLTSLEFMRLNAFDPIEWLPSNNETENASSLELFDELNHLNHPEQPDISGLLSHLRPYQDIGVQWLWFLYRHHLSGLLCDDMGLGKTHQAMALLASVSNLFKNFAGGTQTHFLVVCPTSVIYHWQDKLQQFLPGLKVCTFYGLNRNLDSFHQHYDILLTSYGILRNEKEVLAKIPFEVAIFDEIQIAKNQFSRVYHALTKIKAQMRVGLTGTPIENHLRELKSLFDIILPSYMPAEQDFRNLFIRPIQKEQDAKQKELLTRLIRPFILRRKKEVVLKELPEKIEEIAYADLSDYQNQLYREVLQQRRHHLLEELKNTQHAIPYMHIFALLSSLKQICDHPAVYLKMPLEYKKYESGKWNLFLELLQEARESGQKVVVFSQYLAMLDIIEEHLKSQNIGFASLRGSTQNRKEQLQLFNHQPECEVFVGSLHAAGLGIDLTAGSVVIHYDRWWNAARENQATDRVHRIGQTLGVQVFKLVTKDTFEEKISEMISRKGKLMEDVVGVDDHSILKTFSRDQLMELLDLVNPNSERLHSLDFE